MTYKMRIERFKIEESQKWFDEVELIPYIQFPTEWKVRIIPPFRDAVVRFQVKLPCGTDKSVYLDTRDSLGYWGCPYWEVYPYQGDVGRCNREDVVTLLDMITDTTGETK